MNTTLVREEGSDTQSLEVVDTGKRELEYHIGGPRSNVVLSDRQRVCDRLGVDISHSYLKEYDASNLERIAENLAAIMGIEMQKANPAQRSISDNYIERVSTLPEFGRHRSVLYARFSNTRLSRKEKKKTIEGSSKDKEEILDRVLFGPILREEIFVYFPNHSLCLIVNYAGKYADSKMWVNSKRIRNPSSLGSAYVILNFKVSQEIREAL